MFDPPTLLSVMKGYPLAIVGAFLVGSAGLMAGIISLIAASVKRKPLTVAVIALICSVVTVGVGVWGKVDSQARLEDMSTADGLTAQNREDIDAQAHAIGALMLKNSIFCSAPGAILAVVALILGRRSKAPIAPS